MKTLSKRTNVIFAILSCLFLCAAICIGVPSFSAFADDDTPSASTDLASHLLHRWEFDDGASDLTSTETGDGIEAKTLKTSGTVSNADGAGTRGVRIRNNGFLRLDGGADLPSDSKSVTFAFMFKVNSTASDWPGFIEFIESGSGYRLTYGLGLQGTNSAGGGVSGVNAPPATLGAVFTNNGQWDSFINQGGGTSVAADMYKHVTIQIDESEVRGYRDGVLKTTLSATNDDVAKFISKAIAACKSGTLAFQTSPYYQPDNRTDAYLDDLRVYDGLISPEALYEDATSAMIASVTIGEETTAYDVEDLYRGVHTHPTRLEIIEGETDKFAALPTIEVKAKAANAVVTNNLDDLRDATGTEDASGSAYIVRYTVTTPSKTNYYDIPVYVYKRSVAQSIVTDIKIDGTTIDGFVSNVHEYTQYLSPSATVLPDVAVTPMSPEVTAALPDTSAWDGGDFEYAVTLKDKSGATVAGVPYTIHFKSVSSVLRGQSVLDDTWSVGTTYTYTPSTLSASGRITQRTGYMTVQGGAGIISRRSSEAYSRLMVPNGTNNDVFGTSLTGITVNAWMRFPEGNKQTTEAAVFTLMNANYRVDVRFNGGFRVATSAGRWAVTEEDFEDTRLATGTWRMVSLVVRPDNAYFYIDGQQTYAAENGDVKGIVSWRDFLTNGIQDIRVGRSFAGDAATVLKADIRAVQAYAAPLGESALRGLATSVRETGIDVDNIALAATGKSTFAQDETIEGYAAAAIGDFADLSKEENIYVSTDDDDNIRIYIVSDKRDADVVGLQSFPALTVPKRIGVAADAAHADDKIHFVTTRTVTPDEDDTEHTDPYTEYAYDISGRALTWTVISTYTPNGTDEDRLYRKNYTVTVQYCSPNVELGSLTVDGMAVDIASGVLKAREGQNLAELNVVATPSHAGSECIVDIDATEGRLSVRVLSEFGGKMANATAAYYRIYRFRIQAASNNNYLSSVKVNGVTVVGFDRKTEDYLVGIPYGTSLFDLTLDAETEDRGATVSQPVFDEATRSAKLTVTSAYGDTRVYNFRFEDRSALTTLSSIMIDGEVVEGFDKDTYEYTVYVKSLDDLSKLRISANPVSSGATAYVKTEADRHLATVTVTSEVGTVGVYVLRFTDTAPSVETPEKEGCGSNVSPVSAALAAALLICAAAVLCKRGARRNG